MPLRVSPEQAAERWSQGLSSSGQKITEGIQRVSQAPGAKAAQQVDKWINGVQASRAKWQRNVGAVSLADWQQATITKGVPRVASGAQAGQAKFASKIAPVFAYMSSVLGQVDGMDSSTPAARDARMLYYAQAMRRYGSGT